MKERIAKILLLAAAAAVFSSIFFPYWYLTVKAPQYPKGLHVQVYLNHVTGDVGEIDNLNHYIGMRPLGEAAKLEKKFALPGIAVIVVCLMLAILNRGKFSLLFILPAIVLPAVFAVDLYLWLRDFGLHLNPHAALSSSVKPFVPPLLGQGKIAQFHADANFGLGHGLSMLSAFLSLTVIALRFFKSGASHK
ncbi:MAG: cytochrome C [Candidatus Omnitrophica bacterium]|nr:cytochrome C [Candidatus Omnitrophota bacterium]